MIDTIYIVNMIHSFIVNDTLTGNDTFIGNNRFIGDTCVIIYIYLIMGNKEERKMIVKEFNSKILFIKYKDINHIERCIS